MDVTRLEQRAYIKLAVLRRRNAKDCHCELVEAVGNNDLQYRTVSIIFPLQYGYFDEGTLF